MIALSVFLHTVMVVTLGPLLAGLIRLGSSRGGLAALLGPLRTIEQGLRTPGRPPLNHLAVLAGAMVAGLLIPLFSSNAVLGFLGDGFVALWLLSGLSTAYLPVRASSVLAVATGLWALGTLSGSTDLAQALAGWQAPGPVSILLFLGIALGIAPLLSSPDAHSPAVGNPEDSRADGSDEADLVVSLQAWTRSTLQLGWLALGAMAFPWNVSVTSGATFALALSLFLGKFVALGMGLAAVNARWPKLPTAEIGLACAILALGLLKLGG